MRLGWRCAHLQTPRQSFATNVTTRHFRQKLVTSQRTVQTFATYYEVLGVSASASSDEIKSAFRRQAKLVHPDVSKSVDSEDEFKRLKEAYDTLSDDRQRAKYDEALRLASRRSSGRSAGSSSSSGRRNGGGSRVGGQRQRVVVVDEDGGFPWVEIEVEEVFGGIGDDDDDDMDGFMDDLEYMAWASTPGNLRASFQSSWQANTRKQRRARQRAGPAPLTQDDKDLILQEMSRPLRATAQQIFGSRLQALNTLEELAEVIEAVDELSQMGIQFDAMVGMDDSSRTNRRGGSGRRTGGGTGDVNSPSGSRRTGGAGTKGRRRRT